MTTKLMNDLCKQAKIENKQTQSSYNSKYHKKS